MPSIEDQLVLITPRPDRIELFKSKTDGINKVVASGAELIAGVLGHALAIGLRVGFGGGSEIRIHSGGRRRNVLTEKLLPHKQAAPGQRSIVRFCREREE